MTAAEKYVAAAYLVVFATVLAYVLIISLKLVRLEREACTPRSAVWTSQPSRTPQVAKRPASPGRRASPTKATAASP